MDSSSAAQSTEPRAVQAPVAEVFKAWTTEEGITTFFAPKGKVDLRVDGTYDIWFNPTGKPGERGAEGMRILDIVNNHRELVGIGE